jgi:hypothetical protein
MQLTPELENGVRIMKERINNGRRKSKIEKEAYSEEEEKYVKVHLLVFLTSLKCSRRK